MSNNQPMIDTLNSDTGEDALILIRIDSKMAHTQIASCSLVDISNGAGALLDLVIKECSPTLQLHLRKLLEIKLAQLNEYIDYAQK